MAHATRHILREIEARLDKLRRSERKVAELVLAQSESVIHMRIVDLAAAAQVSEPTVVRFCRAIDCDGFQSFKLELAQSVAQQPAQESFALSDLDTARDYAFKVFDATMNTLKNVRDTLDPDAIQAAVDALCNANRVEFYGFGASSPVAIDAQHKFFRLGVSTVAYSDGHMQVMSASMMGPGDSLVVVSNSGRTRDLMDAIDIARKHGATTIAITCSGSPLASAAHIHLAADHPEGFDKYSPMTSRLMHLTVIDVLATVVALRLDSAQLLPRLKDMKQNLRAKRYA